MLYEVITFNACPLEVPVPAYGPLLLPFYRAGRLGGYVVHDTIDPLDLVDHACRDPLEQVVRETDPVGGHPVLAVHRAKRSHVLVGSLVAHDANRLDREEDGKGLPDRFSYNFV